MRHQRPRRCARLCGSTLGHLALWTLIQDPVWPRACPFSGASLRSHTSLALSKPDVVPETMCVSGTLEIRRRSLFSFQMKLFSPTVRDSVLAQILQTLSEIFRRFPAPQGSIHSNGTAVVYLKGFNVPFSGLCFVRIAEVVRIALPITCRRVSY
jgi:hypothetical protein